MSSRASTVALGLLFGVVFDSAAAAGEPSAFTAFSAGHADVVVSHGDGDFLRFGVIAWGPNWAWTGVRGVAKSDQGAATGALTAKISGTDVPVRIDFRAARPDPKRIQLDYRLQAEAATDLTYIVVEMTPGTMFQGRDVIVQSQGRESPVRCPFARRGLGSQVDAVRMTDARGAVTVLRPQALDRMDCQVAKLKEAGVFVKLSAHFGTLKLGPADKKYVPYLEEFGAFRGGSQRIETPHSAIHYSPELQRVQALQIVNLLKHKNRYTGLTYAEDPVIAYIEIVNEQSIFFYTSMAPLRASPTLRKQAAARFCKWLREKYGDHAKLEKAWGGRQALDSFQGDGFNTAGEHLDKNNILPLGNPWYWDPDQLKGSQAFRKRRLLDSLEFLYELQVEFFRNYERAVREAGYQGELVSSNWQAGRAFSHCANLHSDSLVGTIDRHNYFGGQRANASMLARAGSGMLSSGMQQAADRPFMLSEWIHVFPGEFGVEGPAILGAYGLGLQGWDVSFMFQNGDNGAFSERLGRQAWDVTAPQILGIFPAVARHVHRGDVRQSEAVAVRNVHVPSLFQGKLSFEDSVAQGYDDKELDSSKVSSRTLAIVRSAIAFTDEYTETPAFDVKPYEQDGQLVSSTGELRWKEADSQGGGFFTMNAPGAKAVVGFASGRKLELDRVTIEPRSEFAAVYVTARERDKTVESSRELLIVAIARARNTGMKFSPAGDRMLAPGKPPILMEPVKAAVTIRKDGSPKVFVLDHDGKFTDREIPIENGALTIDGARDKSPYYLVRY